MKDVLNSRQDIALIECHKILLRLTCLIVILGLDILLQFVP